jgi:hypothetical protein
MANFGDIQSDIAIPANTVISRNSADSAFGAFDITTNGNYAPSFISGNWYDTSINASAKTTLAGIADTLQVAPFFPPSTFTIDTWAINCTTAVNPSLARIVVYSADGANKNPGSLLASSGDLVCSTTGVKSASVSLTFNAGTLYWIGVHTSSTQTLRAIAVSALLSLSIPNTLGTGSNTVYRATATYGLGAPNPIGTLTLANSNQYLVGFRVA